MLVRRAPSVFEIIQRKDKPNYSIASVLVSVLEPSLTNSDTVVTVSRAGSCAGVDDFVLSMPCKVHLGGSHQGVPHLLSDEETELLPTSANSIKEVITSIEVNH